MPAKRKETEKEAPATAAADVTAETESLNGSAASRKPIKRMRNSTTPSEVETKTISANERATRNKANASKGPSGVSQYLEDYFDIICSYQDENLRYLANIFYVLPSAKDYPDYYQLIKKPIDLKQIAKRILESKYTSIKQMEADLILMTDNAKRYNEPRSLLYKDACKLKNLARSTCKELLGLSAAGKLFQSNKTHEKKLKLLQEIAETESDESTEKLMGDRGESVCSRADDADDATVNGANSEDDEDEDKLDKSHDSVAPGDEAGDNNDKNALISAMWSLFDYLKDFKLTNQTIIDPFVKLPSKRAYPDYYEEIKNPIALSVIKNKLNKRRYRSIGDLVVDFELLFNNALQYNLEESLIYQHAKVLLEALKQKSGELSINIKSEPSGASSPLCTPSKRGPKPATPNKQTTPHRKSAKSVNLLEHNLKRLFKLLVDHCAGGDEEKSKTQIDKKIPGGRSNKLTPFSVHFMTLPKQDQQPDYYEKVKEPLDLNTIKDRIESGHYKAEVDMYNDCQRVFNNAKLFYHESSNIYQDAVKLQNYFNKRYQVFMNRKSMSLNDSQSDQFDVQAAKMQPTDKPTSHQSLTAPPASGSASSASLPKFADLKEKLVYLYSYINDYQIEGRDLAHPFRHLPSRTEYPDYYNIIKKPMDMTKIWHKLNQYQFSNSYTSMDDMCVDFGQMFENACIYNEPNSMIYKDALNLQRALFMKRDEIVESELNSLRTTSNSQDDFSNHESLPVDFVANQLHELVETLFDSCMHYQDLEGRSLIDSFFQLYLSYDHEYNEHKQSAGEQPLERHIVTFETIRQRIKQRLYKRLDVFQDEMFEIFNQIRARSYLPTSAQNDLQSTDKNKHRIHRNSQLFKDAYELQRYFIQKRDELCRNGELLLSPAMSYKLTSLDSHMNALLGMSSTHAFDETEALLVEERFRPLEAKLSSSKASCSLQLGNFYYVDRKLVREALQHTSNATKFNSDGCKSSEPLIMCLLAHDDKQLIGQIYLKPTDDEFIDESVRKTKKLFNREVLKSDLYVVLPLNKVEQELAKNNCLVIGIKQYIANEANFDQSALAGSITSSSEQQQPIVNITPDDIFVCESIYSSAFKYFRKIINKKWSSLAFISSPHQNNQQYNFTFTKRASPLTINRQWIDQDFVDRVTDAVDKRLAELYAQMSPFSTAHYRHTVQYDSPPASALSKEKDPDEMDAPAVEDDPELMKTAKYYEQLLYEGEMYKLGDHVYVRNPQKDCQLPLIVRIDRLWSVSGNAQAESSSDANKSNRLFFLRGLIFLRPVEIPHDPTRLFYKNEVFQELAKQMTVNLDQIMASNNGTLRKKCTVMNGKKYVSSRITEIDERDVYVCENKYNSQTKVFRKFTRGLKKFELSIKCQEDEIFFLRRELQLRKHLSPLLVNLNINYDDDSADYLKDFNSQFNEDDDHSMRDDENSSQSFNENSNLENPSTMSPYSKPSVRTSFMHHHDNSVNASPSVGAASNSHGSNTGNSTKKVRVKRAKKSGFNLFSKEFRKSLRDTKSSLSFINMSKEVGARWRALSDKERARYEEKAAIETAKALEAERLAAEAQQQQQQQQQLQQQQQQQPMLTTATPLNMQSIQPIGGQQQPSTITVCNANGQMYINPNQPLVLQPNQAAPMVIHQLPNGMIQAKQPQQYTIYANQQPVQASYINLQPQTIYEQIPQAMMQPQQPKPLDLPKHSIHKEAYMRYIANMKKMQNMYQSPAANNPIANAALTYQSDWYTGLDVRPNKIKEKKVLAPPVAWIENCTSGDLMQHMTTLRYHLLNDAINIRKDLVAE